MRNFLIIIGIMIFFCSTVFAAKIPLEVSEYIEKTVPGTDIRFDGVIILPDNTIYLPLYPSLFSDVKKIAVKESFPENQELNQKPDIIIFNNDFVLMKVLIDENGKKTVRHLSTPPLQVRTGLLPQDMLVPSGLILPENIKGIVGNLKIDIKSEDIIKINLKESFEEFLDEAGSNEIQSLIPSLKNKMVFAITNYSKNIQVLKPAETSPIYALAQKSIPISIKPVKNGKFLLVTSFERPFLDIISVADSRFIKQINLSAFPEEILVDYDNNRAYVSAPRASTIFVIDLGSMSLIKKIRVNGYCENLLLADNKIFYVDKLKNDIWAVETENNYLLKNIGKFPNVSSLAYADNHLYIASRTKSRVAVIDYTTLGLAKEFTTVSKPVAMLMHDKNVFILGAQANQIQKVETGNFNIVDTLSLDNEGFSTKFNKIVGTNLAVITDIKKNFYYLFDLTSGKVVKTYKVNVPIKEVIITDNIRLFD